MSGEDQRNLNRLNIPIQKQRSAKADRCNKSTGTIKLLTERPMCNSCANVVTQFTAKYKNIVIEVVDNGHKLYVK